MQKVLGILAGKTLYDLNSYKDLWYYIKMKYPALIAPVLAPAVAPCLERRGTRQGQTLVEYALILAVISIVALGVMINMGQQVKGVYCAIGSVVNSAAASH